MNDERRAFSPYHCGCGWFKDDWKVVFDNYSDGGGDGGDNGGMCVCE